MIRWKSDFTYETLKKGTSRMVCYDLTGWPGERPWSVECTTSEANLPRVAQNRKFAAMAGGDEKKMEALVQAAAKDGTRVIMKYLVLCLLTVVTLLAAQGKQTFTGVVTDDECGRAGHTRMRMGPTDAECAIACVKDHGVQFVLFDGKELYRVSDQQAAEKFAGQKVTVVGTLDAKTKMIQVDSISPSR